MSTRFIAFPKIGQFRQAVKDLYYHKDTLPSEITLRGVVKLHGTNAGIGYDPNADEVWYQKRTSVITPQGDNFGFATYMTKHEDEVEWLMRKLYHKLGEGGNIIVFGEWAGGNIQKGVGISNAEKSFYIFAVYVMDSEGRGKMLLGNAIDIIGNYQKIVNIYSLPVMYQATLSLDFPQGVTPTLEKLTQEVEEECPIAKMRGFEGIGEGIVWHYSFGDSTQHPIVFKVKGEKHSVTKVKKLVSISPEKLESIQEFVEYATTENRLNQGLENVGLDQKMIGKFIGWVNKDIHDEESDTLEANGLVMRDVGKAISNKSRQWYMDKLNKDF